MVLHGTAYNCTVLHITTRYYMVLLSNARKQQALHVIGWQCMTLHGIEGYCIVLHGMERNAWYSVVLPAIDLCSITMNGNSW